MIVRSKATFILLDDLVLFTIFSHFFVERIQPNKILQKNQQLLFTEFGPYGMQGNEIVCKETIMSFAFLPAGYIESQNNKIMDSCTYLFSEWIPQTQPGKSEYKKNITIREWVRTSSRKNRLLSCKGSGQPFLFQRLGSVTIKLGTIHGKGDYFQYKPLWCVTPNREISFISVTLLHGVAKQ